MITAFKTEWAASEMVATSTRTSLPIIRIGNTTLFVEATFLLTPKSYSISLIIFVHTDLKFKFQISSISQQNSEWVECSKKASLLHTQVWPYRRDSNHNSPHLIGTESPPESDETLIAALEWLKSNEVGSCWFKHLQLCCFGCVFIKIIILTKKSKNFTNTRWFLKQKSVWTKEGTYRAVYRGVWVQHKNSSSSTFGLRLTIAEAPESRKTSCKAAWKRRVH